MRTFSDLKQLLELKKTKVTTDEEREKIRTIDSLFKDEGCFFNININIAVGILDFLEVPLDEIKDTYFSLISAENYRNSVPSERIIVSENNSNKL